MNIREFMTTQKVVQRVATYVSGLCIAAIGMDFFVYADLGNTAVTAIAAVFAQMLAIPLGTCLVGLYCVFVLMEVLVLRKDFKWINIGQVPFALILGVFVDFFGQFFPTVPPESTVLCWGLQLLGTVFLSLGILMFVGTELVPMPVEGFSLALAITTPLAFHQCKMIVDSICAVLAIVLSLVGLGELVGIGMGTIYLAFALGWTIGRLKPLLPHWMQNWRLSQ